MKEPYVYCIFRTNNKYFRRINKDLKARKYRHIRAIVPTVSILRKTKKGVNTYEDVPMLFNFGFLKMKMSRAYDRSYLNELKREIPGILSFLMSLETLHPKKLRKRVDTTDIWDDFSQVATITREQLSYYQRLSRKNKIHSAEDVLALQPGDYITLRGYPYDGLDATIKSINPISRMVEVIIEFGRGKTELRIPLDNVLYSAYDNFNENDLEALDYELDMSTIPNPE